jgi:hypothetical protein
MMDIAISMSEVETKHIKHKLRVLAPFRAAKTRRRSLDTTGFEEDSCWRAISVIFTVSCPIETLYEEELYAVAANRLINWFVWDWILGSDRLNAICQFISKSAGVGGGGNIDIGDDVRSKSWLIKS